MAKQWLGQSGGDGGSWNDGDGGSWNDWNKWDDKWDDSSGWVAPPPPGDALIAWGKGYTKGYHQGHHAGFQHGFVCGQQDKAEWNNKQVGKGGGKRAPDEDLEQEEETAEASCGKKKKKKKKGKAWKAWKEKYTSFKGDRTPYFYTHLDGKKVSPYPEEIQEQLKKAKDESDDADQTVDIEYDMTDGWMYKLRIFGSSEKARWEEKFGITAADGEPDGTLVGAQWNMDKGKGEPRDGFEAGVKYRPIFQTDDWEVVKDVVKK